MISTFKRHLQAAPHSRYMHTVQMCKGLYPHKQPSFHASINCDRAPDDLYYQYIKNIVCKKNKIYKLLLYVNYNMFCRDIIFKTFSAILVGPTRCTISFQFNMINSLYILRAPIRSSSGATVYTTIGIFCACYIGWQSVDINT
jgi:hypothetical protein